ncbi:hypothetical protein [Marinobacter xestospongiae]|uniref:hypothetical protein n=1 Tax=Marinobacter xestospongiae TaxID=994319 RepID=UPI0020048598|nr:hypothetical protein [Marinobacter xestospongiae]MCK7567852.1 hypothetical protein [Marinobacter xestospongiae]
MFQLIFKGECAPGTDLATARNNARSLFKASLDQVDKMFSGQRVVIRNKLDEAQAEKYRAVLAKHGMVAHVEPMAAAAPSPQPASQSVSPQPAAQPASPPTSSPQPGSAQTSPPPADSAPVSKPAEPAASGGEGVKVEPGDRLQVAGDKVDDILASSGLTLDPVGVDLAEVDEVEPPMFEHLDEWTIAPAGSDLAEKKDTPPPVVPDTSHLSIDKGPSDDDRKDH